MTEERYLDIVKILSSQKGQALIGPAFKNKFFRKKLVFQSFLQGKATFEEVIGHLQESLWIILPSFLKSSKKPERWKSDLVGRLALSHLFNRYPLDPVELLHYKWYYLPPGRNGIREKYLCFLSMAEIVREIAVVDQYCAREFIKDNAIVIDAGANVGTFSLFAHFLAPHGKIYSFEPLSQTFHILQRNILDNNLGEKILVFQKALGESKGEVKLLVSQDVLHTSNMISDSDFVKGREELFSSSENVPITSIDYFVSESRIEHIDFIKIDTEGYEKQVIKGARNTIKEFSPVIACAAYHLKDDKTKIPALIKSINPDYKYRLEKRAEETLIFWVNK